MTSEYVLKDNNPFPFTLLTATETATTARTPVITRKDYERLTVEYIEDGEGVLEINGRSFHPVKGCVYFLTKGSSHTYFPDKSNPWYKLFFVVEGAFAEQMMKIYGLDEAYCIFGAYELRKYFFEMRSSHANPEEPGEQASIIFHKFLSDASRIYKGVAPIPENDVWELKKKLDNSRFTHFSIEEYARGKKCSAAHIIRSFAKVFSHTPYEYFMERKIERAKGLLLYSNLSIKEISAETGFSDQYYFSSCFKRKTTVSPLHFRNKYQHGEIEGGSSQGRLCE